MATDARFSTALPSHPKTKKLVRQLGGQAGWSLVVLILWAAANRSDGDLSGMSDEDIELASDWDGDEGQFIAALRRIRFVDGAEGETRIHDWTEHQPWASGAEARSLKGKWNAIKKHHGEAEADRQVPEYAAIRHASAKPAACTQDASSTGVAAQQHAPSPAPIPAPSPTPTFEGSRKRSPPIPAPADVDPQVWADWLKLRKDKDASVTTTVVEGARKEAAKAGMSFEDFLREWCVRGTQGLKAEWLEPHKRAGPAGRTPTAAEARALQAVPSIAAPHLRQSQPLQFVEEVSHESPLALG